MEEVRAIPHRLISFAWYGGAVSATSVERAAALIVGATFSIGFCIHDTPSRKRSAKGVRLLLAADDLLDGLNKVGELQREQTYYVKRKEIHHL